MATWEEIQMAYQMYLTWYELWFNWLSMLLWITLSWVVSFLIALYVLKKERRNDIKKEKIKKIEEILIIYNEIFNSISKFKIKWFSFKDLFVNAYLDNNIDDFKKDFEVIKWLFYNKESMLTVKFNIYLPFLMDSYRENIWNVSSMISYIENVVIFDINQYEKEEISKYLSWKKSNKKTETKYDKIDKKYSLYLDKQMEFNKIIKNEINKLLK